MIKYKIKEVKPNVFAVAIPDRFDRCMTFMRVSEYYESPKFKGKNFDIWDFIKWYTKQNDDKFTYVSDWEGFNVPLKVAYKCMENYLPTTKYDDAMEDILSHTGSEDGYLIGVDSFDSELLDHEICHAIYYLNKDYKKAADRLTKTIPKNIYEELRIKLLEWGYSKSVINDEIQAYLMTDYRELSFRNLRSLSDVYKKTLTKYL